MFFFPHSLNLRLHGTPFFSVLIGTICFALFALQIFNDKTFVYKTENYCKQELTIDAKTVFRNITDKETYGCAPFLIQLAVDKNPEERLEFFAYKAQIDEAAQSVLLNEYYRYKAIVGDHLTLEWAHDPENPLIWDYFTSSLLHSDIPHLVFNLIFFFAFSIAAEQLLGSICYFIFVAICCFTTAKAYEYGIFTSPGVLPTIGLSGVVCGVMAFIAFTRPLSKVSVFYWILFIAGRIRFYALFVVAFYILGDIYGLAYLQDENNTNYTAHLAGFATGFVAALLFLAYEILKKKRTT